MPSRLRVGGTVNRDVSGPERALSLSTALQRPLETGRTRLGLVGLLDGDDAYLFGILRGGRRQHRRVTELRMRLHPASMVSGGPMLFPLERAERLFRLSLRAGLVQHRAAEPLRRSPRDGPPGVPALLPAPSRMISARPAARRGGGRL